MTGPKGKTGIREVRWELNQVSWAAFVLLNGTPAVLSCKFVDPSLLSERGSANSDTSAI